MISVTIYKNSEADIVGIKFDGHAGFEEYGKDIVCAAVSVLSINLANSVERFTDDRFKLDLDEKNAYFYFIIKGDSSEASKLLLKSCVLGIEDIGKQYGNKYINIRFQEVK